MNGDLICAAKNGCTTSISALRKVGADVNTIDAEGNSPLIWVTKHGYSFCVNILLQEGVDMNHGNENGELLSLQQENVVLQKLLRTADGQS